MWRQLSPLFQRLRPGASSAPEGWSDRDPLDETLRDAFPRPEASAALQARVAALLPAEAAPTRRRALPAGPWRLAVAGTLGTLLFAVAMSTGKKSGVAYAENAPTAGMLTILDDQGRAAELCPLKHTDVAAEISGYVSRVTVKQQFRNPSTSPVEAVYTFPLPADAAVDDMTMVLGDRVIRGEIKRKEEALRIYEEARNSGRAAALLDQERPNIFTQHVANIMPGQQVTITISYVNLLKYDDGSYEWSFPMVVGPRFTTGSSGYTVPGRRGEPSTNRQVEGDPGSLSVETDAEKITPPIAPKGTRAGHNISVSVNLNAGVPLGDVKSVQHAVNVDRDGGSQARIRLRNEREIPNKDFILKFKVAGPEIRAGLLAHAPEAGKSGYFTLILQPPVAPPQAQVSAKEMVFVIDQTGSQSGEPIKKSKEVMEYCIRQLNPDDTFQILGFNTDVFPCFPAPVRNTPENVRKALDYLRPLEGEGGTDILRAMDHALRIPDDPARLRMICYLTDGYVGNDMQILGYLRKYRGQARMFPFGIGGSVNRFLIEGMAREGRGAPEIVTLDADSQEIAKRFYERISRPLLLDPSIEWNGLPVADVYPQAIPDVFTSGPVIVKGRYTGPAQGSITLRGRLRGQEWSQQIPVTLPALEPGNSAVPTLWAREKIEDLQSQDWLGQQMGRPNPNIQEQIVNLALDYRLMTQHTSLVAVEQRVVNVGGQQRTLDVPVEMPEGVSHEGIFGREQEKDQLAAYAPGPALTAGSPLAPQPGGTSYALARQQGLAEPKSMRRYVPVPAAPAAPMTLAPEPSVAVDGRASPFLPNAELRHGAMPETAARKSRFAPETWAATASKAELGRGESGRSKIDAALRSAQTSDKMEVQIWLRQMPADGLKKLRELGFQLAEELRPGKLLLGTLPAAKLEELAKLPWVVRIEKPRFR